RSFCRPRGSDNGRRGWRRRSNGLRRSCWTTSFFLGRLRLDRRSRLLFQNDFGSFCFGLGGLGGFFVVLGHGEFGESKDQADSASAQSGQISSTELDSSFGTQRQQRGHRLKPSSLQGRILAFIAPPMTGARVTWETMKSSGRKSRCFSSMRRLGSSGDAEIVTDASSDLPNLPAARCGSIDSLT